MIVCKGINLECLKQQQLWWPHATPLPWIHKFCFVSVYTVSSQHFLPLAGIYLHRPFSSLSIAEQHPRKCSESRESFGFRPNYSVTGDKSLPRVEYVWSPSKWCGKIKEKKLTMGHLCRVFSTMTGVTYTAQMHVVCWTELCGGKPPFFEERGEGIVAFNCSNKRRPRWNFTRVGHNIATTQQQ